MNTRQPMSFTHRPKKPSTGKKISVADLKKSAPDYQQGVELLYREEAAKTIQSHMRRALGQTNEIHFFKYITEPKDDGFNEHIKRCVSTYRYGDINYAHPNFVRHLFAALRDGVINKNELLTVKLMYEALYAFNRGGIPEEHHGLFREFLLSDAAGPYQPYQDISYWGEDETKKLQQLFADCEQNKKLRYYTINLPRSQIAALMLYQLHGLDPYNDMTYFVFKAYIKSLDISEKQKQEGLEIVRKIEIDRTNAELLAAYIVEHEGSKLAPYFLNTKETDTTRLLYSLNEVQCQVPFICISPNYDETHPMGRSILCFVLPTIDTLNVLQTIVHGVETTLPEPVVGPLSTRMIRAYDEVPATTKESASDAVLALNRLYPTASALKSPSRPVELTHPDAEKTPEVHGVDCYDFLLSWHDVFHAWRNGANYKGLIRQLRHLHDEKGGFAIKKNNRCELMSKRIWTLTDIDFSHGQYLRKNSDKTVEHFRGIETILGQGGFHFTRHYTTCDKEYLADDNYLLIYALCKKPEEWSAILQKQAWFLEDSFNEMNRRKQQMDAYLSQHPKASIVQIILSDRLAPHQRHDDELLDSLNAQGFKQFIYWSKNDGLCFNNTALKINPLAQKVILNNNPDDLRAMLYALDNQNKVHQALLQQVITDQFTLAVHIEINRLIEISSPHNSISINNRPT